MVSCKPNCAGNRLSTVAGVASHACFRDVGLPFAVDGLGHLQHAPRHHLGVFLVVSKVGGVVAVDTTPIVGRHPCSHGDHETVELCHAQVAQDLDIFISLTRFGTLT